MNKFPAAQDGRRLFTLAWAAVFLVSASGVYRFARLQIQDRLAARRQQLFSGQGANGSRSENVSWWLVLARVLVRDTGRYAFFSGIVTAGLGYALSRLARRLDLDRFAPKAVTHLLD